VKFVGQQLALLRGINVAGKSRVGMSQLRDLFQELGHTDITTYLQSGNVVFNSTNNGAEQIVANLEEKIALTFGFPVSVLLRSANELTKVFNLNPYVKFEREPTKLHVTFLEEKPTGAKLTGVEIPAGEIARFKTSGREIYLHCPDGYGNTKLNNNFFERRLGMRATTRNWRTVTALHSILSGFDGDL
jgi:uncharacterized protein (DUF1697 family)